MREIGLVDDVKLNGGPRLVGARVLRCGWLRVLAVAFVAAVVSVTTAASASIGRRGSLVVSHGARGTSQNMLLNSASCPRRGSCVAVGYGGPGVVVVPVRGGEVGAGDEVKLPAGADNGDDGSNLLSVSCTRRASCVGVGGYTRRRGDLQRMLVVPFQHGKPATGLGVTSPAGASTASFQDALLMSVSCARVVLCVAVGHYTGRGGDEAVVVPITDGKPGAGHEVKLPAGADTSNQDAGLLSVSCAAARSCVAVGSYRNSGGDEAVVVPITDGKPGTAHEVKLPAGAETTDQNADLLSVSCATARSCVAVGSSRDSGGDEAVVVPIAGGRPRAAEKVKLPAGAGALIDQGASLESVSCDTAMSCVAVGSYTSERTGNALVVQIKRGLPRPARQVQLPAGAFTGRDQVADLDSISCAEAVSCVAVGDYTDRRGLPAMVVSITAGSPGAAEKVKLPAGAATTDQGALLDSVSCAQATSCVSVGNYAARDDVFQGLVVPIRRGKPSAGDKVKLAR